jgi:hypothetical protein
VLTFLDDCQSDHFKDANQEMSRMNRLPFILFAYIFGGGAGITLVVMIICYYDDILEWMQRWFTPRANNQQDIELQLFMH